MNDREACFCHCMYQFQFGSDVNSLSTGVRGSSLPAPFSVKYLEEPAGALPLHGRKIAGPQGNCIKVVSSPIGVTSNPRL